VANHYRAHGSLFFWFALLACFIAVGVRGLITSLHSPASQGTGPYCSSDGLLREFLGFRNGSEKILEASQSVPVAQPSIVFWPAKNNNTGVSYLLISYLAWPRRVDGRAISQEQLEREVDELRTKSISAIWLYGLKPSPNLKRWAAVDRGLLLVPAEESR